MYLKNIFQIHPNEIQTQILHCVGFQIQIQVQTQIFVYLDTTTNTYLTPALYSNHHLGPLLQTGFNFNPSMDK